MKKPNLIRRLGFRLGTRLAASSVGIPTIVPTEVLEQGTVLADDDGLTVRGKGWGAIRTHFDALKGGKRTKSKAPNALADEYRSWASICISLIGVRMASLKWSVHRGDLGTARPINRQEDGDGVKTILKPFKRPNQIFSWSSLLLYTQQQMDIYGKAFWYKARNKLGVVSELWPLDVAWFRDFVKGRELGDWIKAFDFQGLGVLPAKDIVYFRWPNPASIGAVDFWDGKSPLETISLTLDHDYYLNRFKSRFFEQDARPSLVISYEGRVPRNQQRAVLEQWQEKFAGNPFLPAILDRGAKVDIVNIDLRKLAVDSMDKTIRNKVLARFHVPITALGIQEDVNRASAIAMNPEFNANAIAPRCQLFQDAINLQLLRPEFDPADEFELGLVFENPVPRDLDMELKQLEAYTPSTTLNEQRRLITSIEPDLILPPLEGAMGNSVFVKVGQEIMVATLPQDQWDIPPQISGQLPIPAEPPALPPPEDTTGDNLPLPFQGGTASEGIWQGPFGSGYNRIKDPREAPAAEIASLLARIERGRQRLAQGWVITATKFWEGQRTRALGRLKEGMAPSSIIDSTEESGLWRLFFAQSVREACLWGIMSVALDLKLTKARDEDSGPGTDEIAAALALLLGLGATAEAFQIASEIAERITARIAETSSTIMLTKLQEIKDSLLAGIQAGETAAQLTARVTSIYDGVLEWQAARITRTEVNAAISMGRYAAMSEAHARGKLKYHMWLGVLDKAIRQSHFIATGQVVEVGQPFKVGGSMMKHPYDQSLGAGPEEVINCRCITVPATKP